VTKRNRGRVHTVATSPVFGAATGELTALGAPAVTRDLRSALFLLAAGYLPGEKTVHEGRDERVTRFHAMVREAAVTDPVWTAGLLGWLRGPGGLRLAPVEGAADFVAARRLAAALGAVRADGSPVLAPVTAPEASARRVIGSVLRRADEPAELIVYWLETYGRRLPVAVKRGIADVLPRLWTPYTVLKYDTEDAPFRFGDVVELVNPRYHRQAWDTGQARLWEWLIARRHGRGMPPAGVAAMARRRESLLAEAVADPAVLADTARLDAAGLTWQNVLSAAGQAGQPVDKARLWEALVPVMPYGALLSNLRAMDETGMSDEVAARVAAKLANPEAVAASGLFPFRFLSARRAAGLRWAWPLQQALTSSLANVPRLPGKVLILVDRSPSMWLQPFSEHSQMTWADAAALFGAALALRSEQAVLAEFWGDSRQIRFRPHADLLGLVDEFSPQSREPGVREGTDIPRALAKWLTPDVTQVVIITDEQTRPGWLASNMAGYGGGPPRRIDEMVSADVPVFLWNFGGYTAGAMASGGTNRHTFGGLTDASFKLIGMVGAGRDAPWPWEDTPAAPAGSRIPWQPATAPVPAGTVLGGAGPVAVPPRD